MKIKRNKGGELSASLREQLPFYGLNLAKFVAIKRNMAFNVQVSLALGCLIEASKVDAYTYLASGARIISTQIGRYSTIGPFCNVGLEGHALNALSTNNAINGSTVFYDFNPKLTQKRDSTWLKQNDGEFLRPLTVGHGVYLEPWVIVPKGGLTIGHGAYIKANTVVTKDVPPYAIVANGPRGSQVIGYRYSDEIIADLLALQWWQYDLPALLSQGVNIPFFDIHAFIALMRQAEAAHFPKLTEQWRYLAYHSEDEVVLYDVTSDVAMLTLFPKLNNKQKIGLVKQEITRQEQYQIACLHQNTNSALAQDLGGLKSQEQGGIYREALNGVEGITLLSAPGQNYESESKS